MPLIRIEFDDEVVSDGDARSLSEVVRIIVSEETGIEDVFVYANAARIKVQIAPIEIFIEMSAPKIADADDLFARIKKRLSEWKGRRAFSHPINLTLIPMNWKFETGI
ncbi:MAG: hypothetical protein KGI97_00515 [Alphaproteobacteria bacterium]|nr:hypothetical protein [Alphaproteobacteria bacterium]